MAFSLMNLNEAAGVANQLAETASIPLVINFALAAAGLLAITSGFALILLLVSTKTKIESGDYKVVVTAKNIMKIWVGIGWGFFAVSVLVILAAVATGAKAGGAGMLGKIAPFLSVVIVGTVLLLAPLILGQILIDKIKNVIGEADLGASITTLAAARSYAAGLFLTTAGIAVFGVWVIHFRKNKSVAHATVDAFNPALTAF